MQCHRIEFHGYGRLVETACDVSDKLVAFLGPNEAGKSTLLSGLAWLESANQALPPDRTSRGESADSREEDDDVVSALYRLTDEELALITNDKIEPIKVRRQFRRTKCRDGSAYNSFVPAIERATKPFASTLKALGAAPVALEGPP